MNSQKRCCSCSVSVFVEKSTLFVCKTETKIETMLTYIYSLFWLLLLFFEKNGKLEMENFSHLIRRLHFNIIIIIVSEDLLLFSIWQGIIHYCSMVPLIHWYTHQLIKKQMHSQLALTCLCVFRGICWVLTNINHNTDTILNQLNETCRKIAAWRKLRRKTTREI